MKKTIFYALLAIMSCTFISCEQGADEKKILGKWILSDITEAEYLNDKLLWSETEAGYDDSEFIDFLSNGEYMSTLFGVGTYSLSEDGKRIYFRENGETEASYWNITELSKNDLTLQDSATKKDEDGTWYIEVQYHFTK